MRVSVIVPCYNSARYVGEALESALLQSHVQTTAIVVDDGSTDETAEIVASFGGRVTLLRQSNRGVSAARNRALDAADSEFVAFLDGDDRWHRDKLARQVAFCQAHPDHGFVHTDITEIDSDGRALPRRDRGPQASGECLAALLARNSVTTSSVLVRRDVLGALRFPIGLHAAEDWYLWLHLAKRTRVGCIAEPLTDYRLHENNTVRRIEFMLRGRLTVLERHLAGGLDPTCRRAAKGHRRYILGQLGHIAYDRGDMETARTFFGEAGRHLDGLGVVRLVAASAPGFVREPARRCWRRLHA
jgi:glycosyltransferase involved in cell wall biosynthesis